MALVPNNVDVRDFGSVGTSDDSPIFQAAINALASTGGTVQIPDMVYNVETQLLLPQVPLGSPLVTIRLRGQTPPSRCPSVIGSLPTPVQGAVLQSHGGTNGPLLACLGGPPGSGYSFSMVECVLENITFRMPGPPVYRGIDLNNVVSCRLNGVSVDSGQYNADATIPGNPPNYGVVLPGNSNGAWSLVDDLLVIGFPTGILWGEHAHANSVSVWGCPVGIEVPHADHAGLIHRYLDVHNQVGLRFTGGPCRLDVLQWAIEQANRVLDLDDPNNYGLGMTRWAAVQPNVGTSHMFTGSGGANFTCTEIGSGVVPPPPPPPGLVLKSTFTAPNGTGITAYTPEIGPPFTVPMGGMQILSGAAYGTTGANNAALEESGAADVTANADIVSPSASGGGVIVRGSDAGFWLLYLETVSHALKLFQVVGQSFNLVASGPWAAVQDHKYTLTLKASGQNLTGYVNGTQVLATTSTFQQTATRCGIHSWSTDTPASNFNVTAP